MKAQIQYHIILTIDVNKQENYCRTNLNSIKPAIVKTRRFVVTETEVEEPEYFSKHRKYCGVVSAQELIEFLDDLSPEYTCQTMGALTLEFGWLPAISFDVPGYYGYSTNAYVSPVWSEEAEKAFEEIRTTDEQKKLIVEREIWPKLEAAMLWLEEEWNQPDAEETIPDVVEVNVEQMQLAI